MSSRARAELERRLGVDELRARVQVLEDEVQECRQLNVRLAELVDVVAELLVPLQERDDAAASEALARFRTALGDPLDP